MKYKIQLGGRGAELYIHRLNKDQIQSLRKQEINKKKIDTDKVLAVIGKDNIDQTKESLIGPYIDDVHTLEVYDEGGNIVWCHYSDDDGSWEYDADLADEIELGGVEEIYADDALVAEISCNGIFRVYELITDEEFDANLLTPKIVEFNNQFLVISDLFYNHDKLEVIEWGDPETKGVVFHLSDEI